jgi:chromosome segregation ATPase
MKVVKKMDERKRSIQELGVKKRENLDAITTLQGELGGSLLKRNLGEIHVSGLDALSARGDVPEVVRNAKSAEEYLKLLKDIADTEALILKIEEDTARLKVVEEDIAVKEKISKDYSRELSSNFTRLGELLFNDTDSFAFISAYEKQARDTTDKIRSLEDQIEEIEIRSDGNIFSRLSRSAKGAALKSFLNKNQENLRRIYRMAGEKYALSSTHEPSSNSEIEDIFEQVQEKRRSFQEISGELSELRSERRKIGDSLGAEGNPVKRIGALEKHIVLARNQIFNVFAAFGAIVSDPAEEENFTDLLSAEDTEIIAKINEKKDVVRNLETRIESLKASLAIDDEKAEIEKLNRSIGEQRQRIRNAERAIEEFNSQIAQSEKKIEELSLLL